MRWILLLTLIALITSCGKSTIVPHKTTPYVEEIPYYFPTMPVTANNPTTVEGVALGRRLYYDSLLHPTKSMSCASCHNQNLAFTTPSSNCLPHINLGWAGSFLRDGKVEGTLEDIMRFEVEDFFMTDINVLNANEEYRLLFEKAFGVTTITSKNVAYALAQFFRTLNSYDSRYDRRMQGLENLTLQEWNGYEIFFSETGDCFHCHGGALFTDNLFHNNALDLSPVSGRFGVTNNSNDIGKFKSPTLRNIEFTAPYMHDGRFQTLEEVVDFYCDGLIYSPTVDPLMKKVSAGGIALNAQDRQDLVAFLKTLSDNTFLTNPELSDPF